MYERRDAAMKDCAGKGGENDPEMIQVLVCSDTIQKNIARTFLGIM